MLVAYNSQIILNFVLFFTCRFQIDNLNSNDDMSFEYVTNMIFTDTSYKWGYTLIMQIKNERISNEIMLVFLV